MHLPRRATRRSPCQRLASATLIVSYVLTAAGVPLPAGNSPRTSGELYPCAGCGCGCASAEQCWRSCCCHTLAQRFDWAREHDVRPPEFAIAMARQAGLDVAWLGERSNGQRCCPAISCYAHHAIAARPNCCRQNVAACESTRAHACCTNQHGQRLSRNAAGRVLGWRSLECQGKSSIWLAAVPTLIVPTYGLSNELALVERLGPTLSEHADRVADLPAIPPPQRT